MENLENENVVTLKIPAAWYAVLMQELYFAMCIVGGMNGHNVKNCETLIEMLVKQGGGNAKIGT